PRAVLRPGARAGGDRPAPDRSARARTARAGAGSLRSTPRPRARLLRAGLGLHARDSRRRVAHAPGLRVAAPDRPRHPPRRPDPMGAAAPIKISRVTVRRLLARSTLLLWSNRGLFRMADRLRRRITLLMADATVDARAR